MRWSGIHGRTAAMRALAATALVTAALVTVSATPAAAVNYCGLPEVGQNVYVGANDGSWTLTTNWSKGVLPGIGDICVPGGKVVRVPNGTEMVFPGGGSIGTLRIEGTVRISDANAVVWTNNVYGGTNLINGGVIQVLNGSTLHMSADQNGAPAFQNTIGGSQIQVSAGSSVLLERPLSNNGTIDLTGGGALTLNSAASNISGLGTVVGGQVRLDAGSVDFGGGAMQVLATGGSVRGTIAPSQSLDIACKTASGGINLPNGLVNNGTMRMLPPLAGNCSIDIGIPGGTTFTNNGVFVVGDPSVHLGWSHFGTNVYNSGGTMVNGPTGTMTINDFFSSALSSTTNQGTLSIGPFGTFDHSHSPVDSSGTIANSGTCDLLDLTNSGTLDLAHSCLVRRKAVLTSSSVLKVYSSATELTNINGMSQASTIAGSVHVVTDTSAPPALGTTRPVFTAPASGQFSSVTSASPTIAYTAVYPPNSGGVAQLQAVAPTTGGGGGGGGGGSGGGGGVVAVAAAGVLRRSMPSYPAASSTPGRAGRPSTAVRPVRGRWLRVPPSNCRWPVAVAYPPMRRRQC